MGYSQNSSYPPSAPINLPYILPYTTPDVVFSSLASRAKGFAKTLTHSARGSACVNVCFHLELNWINFKDRFYVLGYGSPYMYVQMILLSSGGKVG